VIRFQVVRCSSIADLSADIGSPIYEFVAVPEVGEEYPINEVPLEVAKRNFVECAQEIAAYAETKDVPVMIEPINRYEAYMGTLNSVADTVDVIDQINSTHLGVLRDFFHANIEDTSIVDALLRAGDKLMHIHLSDSNRFRTRMAAFSVFAGQRPHSSLARQASVARLQRAYS